MGHICLQGLSSNYANGLSAYFRIKRIKGIVTVMEVVKKSHGNWPFVFDNIENCKLTGCILNRLHLKMSSAVICELLEFLIWVTNTHTGHLNESAGI